jgi:hypothetical protein
MPESHIDLAAADLSPMRLGSLSFTRLLIQLPFVNILPRLGSWNLVSTGGEQGVVRVEIMDETK